MVLRSTKGFTLVELLLSVLILAIAIGGVLLLYTSSMVSSQTAWDTTVAVSHAEHILEDMQARDSLSSILANNWKVWADQEGLNTLPEETIEVTFNDSSSNLLDIQVSVNWMRKRAKQVTLKTRLTK